MKTKFIPLLLLFLFVAVLPSCSNDDDKDLKKVSTELTKKLNDLYPGVKRVDWKKHKDYKVAEFNWKGYDTEVWFDKKDNWKMTDTDYDTNEDMVPQVVLNNFYNMYYKDWKLDDIHYFERTDLNFYIIEVEQGKADTGLVFDENGQLLKTIENYNSDNILPNTQILNVK